MTGRRKFLATSAMCFWTLRVGSSLANEQRQKGLRCFDATLYSNKPALRDEHVEPMPIVYEATIWGKDGTSLVLPSDQELSIKISTVASRSPLVVLDIERFPNGTPDAIKVMNHSLLRILAAARAGSPQTRFGFYSLIPMRDYWRALKGAGSEPYSAWQRENDRFSELASAVDFLAPSLYTFYDDISSWRRYAIAQIAEARRIAPNRPVFPFVWPRFHESNESLGNRYVPSEMWTAQLALGNELADGVIIWGGWKEGWSEQAQWWTAVKRLCRTT